MPTTKHTLTITPSLAHLAEQLRPLGLSLNDLLRLALWCNPPAESVAAHLSAADLPTGCPKSDGSALPNSQKYCADKGGRGCRSRRS